MGVVAYERPGASSPLRELANTASALLSEHPHVVGVCLIGSVARGNDGPSSDVRRLNGNCLFALARIYSVGKAVAIARTVELGSPRFVKEEGL